MPCSLADWLGPAHAHSSGAAAPAAMERPGPALEEGGSGALADGSAYSSGLAASEQAGSSEDAAAPAEASAPAIQPGLGEASGRAAVSGGDTHSSRGGEAGCSGRGARGGDAPLLVHFAEKVRAGPAALLLEARGSVDGLMKAPLAYGHLAQTQKPSGLSFPHGQLGCACNRTWTRRCWQPCLQTSGGSCSAHCSSDRSGKGKPSAARSRRAQDSYPRRPPSGLGRARAAMPKSHISMAGRGLLERPMMSYKLELLYSTLCN